ncbi:MAG: ATP-grasp domain-containing protein [Ignavibacteriaceae bacterium]|nr:ATP-grasp domain-containing protein [Ignavibacteriaceae bacterium]
MKIAVTGLNATDNPGPGVPLIRCLQEDKSLDFTITGLIYDSLEPGIYMDDIAESCHLIPYPSSGLDSLFDRIRQINETEKIDMIIPTLDSELYGFVKIQKRLEDIGIKTYLPGTDMLNIRAKDKLFNFCKSNNINVPKNILVSSVQDLYGITKEFEYPVAVKGIFYDAYIVNNFDEAVTAFKKISSKWGFPVIIQEYIKGSEFNVVALGDGTGGTVGAVAMRKLYITDKGKGWAGVSIEDEPLIEMSKKIIEKIKWRSGMELEYIKSAQTNEYYLLEINPRFPAWVYLSPNTGQNLPAAMVKLAMGEKQEYFTTYKTGIMFVRCSWDLISDVSKLAQISTSGVIYNGK